MNDRPTASVRALIITSLASFGVFAVIAWNVQQKTVVTEWDEAVALRMQGVKRSLPNVTAFVEVATDLGAHPALLGTIAMTAVVVLWRCPRYWPVPLIWLGVLMGGQVLQTSMKELFQRPRPLDASHWVTWSFPSGHADNSLVNYGMLAYILVQVLPARGPRIVVVGTLALIVLFVGFSRMYLTVHYLSDVLGGFALGTGWLTGCLAGIEYVRRRRLRKTDET